ncbi:hypothetical protein BGZ68_004194, partial [Mortierella alpina]
STFCKRKLPLPTTTLSRLSSLRPSRRSIVWRRWSRICWPRLTVPTTLSWTTATTVLSSSTPPPSRPVPLLCST